MAFELFAVIVLLLLLSCTTLLSATDNNYQVILSETGINKLAQQLLPVIETEILSTTIPPQTIDTALTIDLHEISFQNLSVQNASVALDGAQQSITLDLINVDLSFNSFKFYASKDVVFYTLSCSGYMTPELHRWNFSVTLRPLTDNCSIGIQMVESQTVIAEGAFELNYRLLSESCQALSDIVDFFIDIEQTIKDEITAMIPQLINDELQNALNAFLSDKAENLGDIQICYKNASVSPYQLLIAGDLQIPESVDPPLPAFTTTEALELIIPEEPIEDNLSMLVFVIVMLFFSCFLGCGVAAGVFYACNKDNFSKLNQYKKLQTNDNDQ